MVTLSPVGLAAAAVINQVALLATFKERLCKPFCIDSTVQPQVSVLYTKGTPTLVGTTVFVPIKATITVVTPSCRCSARTQLFTENFTAAFQGQTALPTNVTISSLGTRQGGACIRCGKAHAYVFEDSLTITIS